MTAITLPSVNVEEKLFQNRYRVDAGRPHILIKGPGHLRTLRNEALHRVLSGGLLATRGRQGRSGRGRLPRVRHMPHRVRSGQRRLELSAGRVRYPFQVRLMDNIHTFLAHAIRLESAAAQRSDELADAMQTWGNKEVEAFFRRMAEYSRLHLKEAMARAGFRQISELPDDGYEWPDGVPPESSDWWGVDGLMGIEHAMEMALEGEQRGLDYYEYIASSSSNAKVRAMAEEFAAEEREHVAELERVRQKHAQDDR